MIKTQEVQTNAKTLNLNVSYIKTIKFLLIQSILGPLIVISIKKNAQATMNQTLRHMTLASQLIIFSFTVFSFLSVFFNSSTVFFVLVLDWKKLSSILLSVSPYSATISLRVSCILLIFWRDVETLTIFYVLCFM